MAYRKGHYHFKSASAPSDFAKQLGLKNLGFSVYALSRGEGFDFFHSHRDQEEVYYCIDGTADLLILKDDENQERITLAQGDIVRVEPNTLRAIGNLSSDRAVLVIAGACSHPYPAGFDHHDVIADVLSVCGQGTTGFTLPKGMEIRDDATEADDELE